MSVLHLVPLGLSAWGGTSGKSKMSKISKLDIAFEYLVRRQQGPRGEPAQKGAEFWQTDFRVICTTVLLHKIHQGFKELKHSTFNTDVWGNRVKHTRDPSLGNLLLVTLIVLSRLAFRME